MKGAVLVGLLGLHSARADGDYNIAYLDDAKCIDGTPAAYYLARNESSQNLVVWLEGGGICESLDDCIGRANSSLGSSKFFGPTITMGGMMSSDPAVNPDFYTWNRVFIPYQSGDIWVGTTTDAVQPFPQQGDWKGYFHGHRIVESVFKDLDNKYGASNAEKAILTGCSAGGIGTIFNCDWFASQFGSNTDVGCRPEAGWFGAEQAQYQYYNSPGGAASDPDPRKNILSNWTQNVGSWALASPAGQACAADVASGKRTFDNCDGQKLGPVACCGTVMMAYQYSKTRMFISQNQADAYQVFVSNACPSASSCKLQLLNKEVTEYWSYLQNTITQSLADYVVTGSKADQDGIFAPACLQHCMTWQGIAINGRNDQQAFGDWYFRRGQDDMTYDTDLRPVHMCDCANN